MTVESTVAAHTRSSTSLQSRRRSCFDAMLTTHRSQSKSITDPCTGATMIRQSLHSATCTCSHTSRM